jgi:hypothetical protein
MWGKHKDRFKALFEAEDQERVRADLTVFFGPRAQVFLDTYEKMRARGPSKQLTLVATWCWPAFFASFAWYFYRKMYLMGGMLVILPIVMGLLLGGTGSSGMWVIFTMMAKPIYVQTALRRITKADGLGLAGEERRDYLQRAGGVSLVAGLFTGFIYVGLIALTVMGTLAERAGN